LHQDRGPIARRALPARRISDFARLKLHDLISFSDFRAKIRMARPRLACAQQKTRRGIPPGRLA
jgi:hypothetical protein